MRRLLFPIYFSLYFWMNFWNLSAQTEGDKFHKNVYLEQVGVFVLPFYTSVNYDMRFTKGIQNKWGFRTGIGIGKSDGTEEDGVGNITDLRTRIFASPLEINYLFGKHKHSLELAVGLNIRHLRYLRDSPSGFVFDDNETSAQFSISALYRTQPLNNGIFFSIGHRVIMHEDLPFPFLSIGLGYGFK